MVTTKRKSSLEDLKNIGPVMAGWLERIGVRTVEDIERRGVVEVAKAMRAAGFKNMNLMGVYALQGAILDMNCLELPLEMRDILRQEWQS